jgi:hypothetical protein
MTRRGFLGLVARTTVAAVALCFLISALTWHDQVILPPGFTHEGRVLTAGGGRFAITAQGRETVRIEVPGSGPAAVPVARFGTQPADAHLSPGILTVLARARFGLVVCAVAMIGVVTAVQALRWWLLLRARGFTATFGQILRLHLVGCFWNCLFPGLTGGDAVKVWHVAQATGRVADAFMSVLIDRFLGLTALITLSAGAALAIGADPTRHGLALRIWSVAAAIAVVVTVLLTPVLRRAAGLGWAMAWARRRPRLAAVIDALAAYHGHRLTLLWGFACSGSGHLLAIGGCIVAGRALGLAIPWPDLLMLLPIVFLIGSLPISLFGLGVMEVAAVALLGSGSDANANQIVGMLVISRVALLASALPGGWFVATGHGRWKRPDEAAIAAGETA